MKKNYGIWLWLLALSSIFAACKKGKATTNPEDQLPPATQTGTNTFGCLVNGKVFVPTGYTNPYPNYRVFVDPGNNGNLDIRTYSFINGNEEDLDLAGFGITSTGTFILNSSQIYPDYIMNINSSICRYIYSANNFKSGYLKINKYDLTQKIISGEFEFKLYDNTISCDTIRITQGRFDTKF